VMLRATFVQGPIRPIKGEERPALRLKTAVREQLENIGARARSRRARLTLGVWDRGNGQWSFCLYYEVPFPSVGYGLTHTNSKRWILTRWEETYASFRRPYFELRNLHEAIKDALGAYRLDVEYGVFDQEEEE
jgi:hypothetical protein